MRGPKFGISQGCLVEYLQNDLPVLGFVLEDGSKQLRILNINKRTLKLSVNQVLPWIGPGLDPRSSREEILESLTRHERERNELQVEVRPDEIWELAQDSVREATVQWLAELVWDEPDPDRLAALGRVLIKERLRFKFQPPSFRIVDSETVSARMREQEEEQRRNRLLRHGNELFHALWNIRLHRQKAQLPDTPPDLVPELERLLLERIRDPEAQDRKDLWTRLTAGLPQEEHLPLLLAQAWGLLPEHYNYLLDRADYEWGDAWSSRHDGELRRQREEFPDLRREPEPLPLISIDSATTSDIDDAFHLEKSEQGYRLYLALARPCLNWEFGSDLDRSVAHRYSSLYLPEGTSHMLPEELGAGLYSLHAGQGRPVLLLRLELDGDGSLLETHIRATWARVEENASYATAEQRLAEGGDSRLLQALELAAKLRRHRIGRGAVILQQQDPILRLDESSGQVQVILEQAPERPNAQLLVSELMILANRAAAEWARERNIPLLHRTQDIRLSPESAGVWSDPASIFQHMREMAGAKLDVDPRPHCSLGMSCYAPITSPLRRYQDFLNVAQLESATKRGSPRWSAEGFREMLPHLSGRAEAASRVQRYRVRYWKLLYFRSWCKVATWPAVVVANDGQLVTVSLPREQIFLRAPKSLFGDKVVPGQPFQVRLGKIDPLNNEIKILSAREE